MAYAQKAEGIILRKYPLRETSYILVIYTKEFGKLRGVIKGVRGPRSSFGGDLEIFSKCEVLFYKKKRNPLDLITQCEMLEFFLPVRKDLKRITYANYFLELVDITSSDYDVNEELYRTLEKGLRMLSSSSSARRVSRIFELKFLASLGLSPNLSGCASCGKPAEEAHFFSAKEGGVLCASCRGKDASSFKVSMGTINFMRKIQASEMAKTSIIKVSKEVGKETERALKRFLAYYINRPIKSLRFLESLERAA